MASPENPTTLDIIVESRQALERLLNRALIQLQPAAEQANSGIKVTKTGPALTLHRYVQMSLRPRSSTSGRKPQPFPGGQGNQVCHDD